MGIWYRTGAVAVQNGSANIVGTGTLWVSQASVGDLLIGPDAGFYEITGITDDTHLSVRKLDGTAAYAGATANAQAYAIIRNFTSTLPAQLASQLAGLMTRYHGSMDELTAWLSGSGIVTIHDSVGNAYQVKTPAQLAASVTTLAASGGTINGVVIGGTSPAAANVTTLSASGLISAPGIQIAGGGEIARFGAYGTTTYDDFSFQAYAGYNLLTTKGATPLLFGTGGVEGFRLDANRNLGIGVIPCAWSVGKAVEVGYLGSALWSNGIGDIQLTANAYYNGGYKYAGSGSASRYYQDAGAHVWMTAPSGTAGNAISFTQAMGLDSSVDSSAWNAAATGLRVGKTASTGRSINAAGTVNASGADYAEYEQNNGLSLAKGSIVGFKPDGTLTSTFSEAIRFAIKSTNPSYVGGDTWGGEDRVGVRPVAPVFTAPDYTGSADPGVEPQMAITPADATEEQIASAQENHLQAVEVWRQASSQYRIDQQSHAAQVAAAHASHDVQMAAYQTSLSSWEEAFEAARQKVDRIAYSGKVPVNVIGATPGQYVIAVAASDGSITGHVIDKSALSFQQYQDAVGRVNRILPDGRAEVAVIIH